MNTYHERAVIETLIATQLQALREKDVNAAVENYHTDVVVFDVVGPLSQTGVSAIKTRLTEWLSGFEEVAVVSVKLVVEAGEHHAFSNGFNHVMAKMTNGNNLDMYWRETLCWQKVYGEWKIMAAHSSVPFDATTGMASTGLKP